MDKSDMSLEQVLELIKDFYHQLSGIKRAIETCKKYNKEQIEFDFPFIVLGILFLKKHNALGMIDPLDGNSDMEVDTLCSDIFSSQVINNCKSICQEVRMQLEEQDSRNGKDLYKHTILYTNHLMKIPENVFESHYSDIVDYIVINHLFPKQHTFSEDKIIKSLIGNGCNELVKLICPATHLYMPVSNDFKGIILPTPLGRYSPFVQGILLDAHHCKAELLVDCNTYRFPTTNDINSKECAFYKQKPNLVIDTESGGTHSYHHILTDILNKENGRLICKVEKNELVEFVDALYKNPQDIDFIDTILSIKDYAYFVFDRQHASDNIGIKLIEGSRTDEKIDIVNEIETGKESQFISYLSNYSVANKEINLLDVIEPPMTDIDFLFSKNYFMQHVFKLDSLYKKNSFSLFPTLAESKRISVGVRCLVILTLYAAKQGKVGIVRDFFQGRGNNTDWSFLDGILTDEYKPQLSQDLSSLRDHLLVLVPMYDILEFFLLFDDKNIDHHIIQKSDLYGGYDTDYYRILDSHTVYRHFTELIDSIPQYQLLSPTLRLILQIKPNASVLLRTDGERHISSPQYCSDIEISLTSGSYRQEEFVELNAIIQKIICEDKGGKCSIVQNSTAKQQQYDFYLNTDNIPDGAKGAFIGYRRTGDDYAEAGFLKAVIYQKDGSIYCIDKSNKSDTIMIIDNRNTSDECFSIIQESIESKTDSILVKWIPTEKFLKEMKGVQFDSLFNIPLETIEYSISGIFKRYREEFTFDIIFSSFLHLIAEEIPFCNNFLSKSSFLRLHECPQRLMSEVRGLKQLAITNLERVIEILCRINAENKQIQHVYLAELQQLSLKLIESKNPQIIACPNSNLALLNLLSTDITNETDDFSRMLFVGNEENYDDWCLGKIILYAKGIDSTAFTFGPWKFCPNHRHNVLFLQGTNKIQEYNKKIRMLKGFYQTLLLPANYLVSRSYINFRLNNLINFSSIILLPNCYRNYLKGLLSIIILQDNRLDEHKAKFVDATTKKKTYVSGNHTPDVEGILKALEASIIKADAVEMYKTGNYTLNPFAYDKKYVPQRYNKCSLGSLIRLNQEVEQNEEKGRLVSAKVLPSSHGRIVASELDPFQNLPKHNVKITQKAMIISVNTAHLYPTIVENQHELPIYIEPSLLTFTVDENKVSYDYLCDLLSQQNHNIQTQIDMCRKGDGGFDEDAFLDIVIALPPKHIQDEFIREKYLRLDEKNRRQLQQQEIDSFAELEEDFKSLKHALGKPIGGINAAIANIFNNLSDDILDIQVSKRSGMTLREELNLIKDSGNHISNLMQSGANFLDVHKNPLQSIPICDILPICKYDSQKFILKYEDEVPESAKQLTVKANKTLLEVLFNDIFSNADNHAFDGEHSNNAVKIEAKIIDKAYVLYISNNGKPFPQGIDTTMFTKRRWTAGNTGGSGIGGNDIARIMSYFAGEFKLITNYDEEFQTCYRLSFPIE